MKNFMGEFKKFIMRGNVMDMAVGVIIGGAFSGVVKSLVDDVLMPLLGLLIGKVEFSTLFITLDGSVHETLAAAREAGAPVFAYGSFIQNVVQFIILAFAVFLIVKGMNKLQKPAPAAAPTTKVCPFCKSEIHIDAVKCPHCASEITE